MIEGFRSSPMPLRKPRENMLSKDIPVSSTLKICLESYMWYRVIISCTCLICLHALYMVRAWNLLFSMVFIGLHFKTEWREGKPRSGDGVGPPKEKGVKFWIFVPVMSAVYLANDSMSILVNGVLLSENSNAALTMTVSNFSEKTVGSPGGLSEMWIAFAHVGCDSGGFFIHCLHPRCILFGLIFHCFPTAAKKASVEKYSYTASRVFRRTKVPAVVEEGSAV